MKQNNIFNPPEDKELEITIFGSGFGESILIHLTNGRWLIVDSCVSNNIKLPCPLEYLQRIGVDIEKSVSLVVTTHWHDDHIKGMSKILELCPNAEYVFSAAFNDDKFKKLVMDSSLTRMDSVSSGISEISKTWMQLRKSNNRPAFAIADQLLLDKDFQVYSLSPNNTIFEKALLSIISQLPEQMMTVKRIAPPNPNYTSVVLWLKNGLDRMLLGADLEEAEDHKGWSEIIKNSKNKPTIFDKKAKIYKVAHHGSETGHHDEIWTTLLESDPICLIAPFNKNPKLPSSEDVERITKLSDSVFISSALQVRAESIKSQDKHVKRTLQKRNASYVDNAFSFVRHRKRKDEEWRVELFGNAEKLPTSR